MQVPSVSKKAQHVSSLLQAPCPWPMHSSQAVGEKIMIKLLPHVHTYELLTKTVCISVDTLYSSGSCANFAVSPCSDVKYRRIDICFEGPARRWLNFGGRQTSQLQLSIPDGARGTRVESDCNRKRSVHVAGNNSQAGEMEVDQIACNFRTFSSF